MDVANQKIRFSLQDKVQDKLKQAQNELKNQTRFYFRNDVVRSAQQVQHGKMSIHSLYERLNKMKYSNLLKAYDHDYADVLHNGMNNLTGTEAYACYLKYPEQYQSWRDFRDSILTSPDGHPTVPKGNVGERYERLLRKDNHIKARAQLVEKVMMIFGTKDITQRCANDYSISLRLTVRPHFFTHTSLQSIRAILNRELLGQVDYQLDHKIDLPVNIQQKKPVHVQILDGEAGHLDYEPADLDIILKSQGKKG